MSGSFHAMSAWLLTPEVGGSGWPQSSRLNHIETQAPAPLASPSDQRAGAQRAVKLSPRAAAEQHGKNDHAKGKEHSAQAQQQSKMANESSEAAHKKSASTPNRFSRGRRKPASCYSGIDFLEAHCQGRSRRFRERPAPARRRSGEL
jgi:hypothetical protein